MNEFNIIPATPEYAEFVSEIYKENIKALHGGDIYNWDSDFSKVTPEEAERIKAAEESGFISDNEINWDKIGH